MHSAHSAGNQHIVDFEVVEQFLRLLDPEATKFIFCSNDDDKDRDKARRAALNVSAVHEYRKAKKEGHLTDQIRQAAQAYFDAAPGYSPMAPCLPIDTSTCNWMNARHVVGCNVCVTIQTMKGEQRGKAHVIRIRAFFAEMDQPPTKPWPLPPSVIVETSPGKQHVYWLVVPDSRAVPLFNGVQQRIVEDYGADPSARDLARYLRLPGSWNLKPGRPPHQVRIIGGNGTAYQLDTILTCFPPVQRPERKSRAVGPAAPITDAKLREIDEAVSAIDLDERDIWLKVGMALHAFTNGADEGLDIWTRHSWEGEAGECEHRWSTFRGGATKIETVFWLARQAGWRGPSPAAVFGDTVPLLPPSAARAGSSMILPPSPAELAARASLPTSAPDQTIDQLVIDTLALHHAGVPVDIVNQNIDLVLSRLITDQMPLAVEEQIVGRLSACNVRRPILRSRLIELKRQLRPSGTVVGMDGQPFVSSRPMIRIIPGTMHKMVVEAEQALIAAGVPIYARQTSLVRPVAETVSASRKRKTRVPRLVDVKRDFLWNELSEHAGWERYLSSKGDWVPADPPKDAADVMLSREGHWQFPQISGLICCPTMLTDGRLILREGLDEETGLLLWSPPPMPVMSERPARADAEAALHLLAGLLGEFPFINEIARSVALSALMTPVLRGGMDAAPAHGFRAHQAGTGKSYLQDLAAAICIGDLCPVMSIGKNDEESEKRLSAALVFGQPIISFDNVNGVIGFDLLCQSIDRPIVEIRILGQTKKVRVPNRSTIFLNGNNMRVTGDMCRRVIVSTLDSKLERPELRNFRRNPLAEILADRGRYVAAILIIARAYIAAGRPGLLPPIQSFGDWSDIVRSALVWLGCADPAEAMRDNFKDDPERQIHSEFMQAFVDNLGDGPTRPWSVSDLMIFGTMGGTDVNGQNYPMLGFRRVMEPWTKKSPSALGKWLSNREGSNVDNMIIRKIEDPKNGHRWFVEKISHDL
jgi:hypothetical protein